MVVDVADICTTVPLGFHKHTSDSIMTEEELVRNREIGM